MQPLGVGETAELVAPRLRLKEYMRLESTASSDRRGGIKSEGQL